ncbi:hypothetical protein P154DRAFT_479752 [Amniculicola lignicola CBS 123094]|uniref:Uncharacterized protein n=1 Tax=Amniculicola lignicola CBS 123094 TaxID=1392246 RepID=A0A6A5X5D8_9PLEO|nr:hypothetical protein P154DRAFT_479752 [Amniculicola lignicola CBS 123094]
MALEPSANPQASLQLRSPTASGRSSPSPRASRNTTEDPLYKKDKGFRRYAAGVERALALWDAAQQEWADYISFLGRLLKALQAHPGESPAIPHSGLVAHRLSQCLNPALPSGVHQKALEVYAYIFATIGTDALSRDLHLYFPGLATVLSFASLSVRPLFLSIFEKYILKIDGAALRPALKAIILSILPGLEDETSEDFERMVAALDKLRESVKVQSSEIADAKNDSGSSHFWQCFFLAAITNASRRQGALAYLIRRLPRFGVSNGRAFSSPGNAISPGSLPIEAEGAISPEPGLLIRCFEAGLSDPQLLIQRGFLDLLVTHLPLDSPVLQQRISKGDLERLVAAASSVVSRRDMSLNRRLWAWFLGPEPTAAIDGSETIGSPTQDFKGSAQDASAHHAEFFSHHGLQALTNSIMKLINRPSTLATDRARPFRICLSLMDRWEVGGLIVPEIFLPALQSIQSYSEVAAKDYVDEVMKSASVFFDGVESGLIWGKLIHLVTSALSSKGASHQEAIRKMKLAKFVLARFNLKEEEMVVHHMPLMILSILAALNDAFEDALEDSTLDAELLDLAFEIADSLVQIIPDRALRGDREDETATTSTQISREIISQRIHSFYEESQGNLDFSDPPFAAAELGQTVMREASRMFSVSLERGLNSSAPELPSRILSNLIYKIQDMDSLEDLDPLATFEKVLSTPPNLRGGKKPPFKNLIAITTLLSALQLARPSAPFISGSQLPEILHPLVACLWDHLSPLMPKYHVEAVRSLLQLHAISASDRMVEAAISAIMVQEASTSCIRSAAMVSVPGRRFAVLWSHTMHEMSLRTEKRGSATRRVSGIVVPPPSTPTGGFEAVLMRPLLLLLDSLNEESTELSSFVRGWIHELPTLNKVFDVLATHMQSLQCLATDEKLLSARNPSSLHQRKKMDDTKEFLYYLKHFHNMLRQPSQYMWAVLAEELAPSKAGSSVPKMFLQEWIVRTCLQALSIHNGDSEVSSMPHVQELYRTAVTIINLVYHSPFAYSLRELELEVPLMARLSIADPALQSILLDALLSALKLRLVRPPERPGVEPKPPNGVANRPRLSLAMSRESEDGEASLITPPPQLVDCLKYGFSSTSSRLVLDDWIHFLTEVLPLFADTVFQNLLPLVDCLCKQITTSFEQLKSAFNATTLGADISPESTLISLINGLEQILAKAHDRLMLQETKSTAHKSPEQPQGFFGTMVSGVFATESNQLRTPTANSRLTVLLCFQDTVRICFAIWSWGGYGSKDIRPDPMSSSSFAYTSLRMRNRARRILEHLFAAEALECLETLTVLWAHSTKDDLQATAIMGLLNVLNGSKPKHTIPAIFNALYSRTNPHALDANRMSTLTSDLTDTDLVAFLVDYTKSLEDDAMDEIWSDCTLFLRDVLANPLPHRQILPTLLEFTAVIGQKVDNTNFGEQKKMRKELADIFTRILTAVFTTRSMGFLQDPSQITVAEKLSTSTNGGLGQMRATDVVSILTTIAPHLPIVLVDNDRVSTVVTSISTSAIGPTFRAKGFPEIVSKATLDLLYQLTRVAPTNKFWKKDLYDAFNDSRFFQTPLPLLRSSWIPILARWTNSDKDRLPELLSRLSAPTTAGIMFGVGATSARQEADRRTQLTLRRITLLILASSEDIFTPNLQQITDRIVELLTATPASSPSSSTRSEVFVLIRALILKTSSIHLAPLWPIINDELTSALSSLLPDADNKESYNNFAIVQTCKLLDQLVVLDPDDFQLIEWLFISDTIDAVYKPPSNISTPSLTDEIAEILSQSETPTSHPRPPIHAIHSSATTATGDPKRTLFLDPLIAALEKEEGAEVTDMARRELVDRVVRPFLGNLAMVAFESTYGGGEKDSEAVWESVVKDAKGME